MSVRRSLLSIFLGRAQGKPPDPVHVEGTTKGEELARKQGREPGRQASGAGGYRTARDATSVSPDNRKPIHPDMPHIPPA